LRLVAVWPEMKRGELVAERAAAVNTERTVGLCMVKRVA
jgi:hypothetical protein